MRLIVAAVQTSPVEGEVEENLRDLGGLINKAADNGAGLVVLPEICDIGYNLELIARDARPFPNRSTDFLSAISKKNNIMVVAGLAERKSEGIFNSAVVFGRDGKIVAKYYKTHLCPLLPLNEPVVFKAGSDIFIIDIEGLKIGVTICFDIRFPEVYRRLAGQGAQIIVHPTAFPEMRIDELNICARARAIENQYYIVAANQCGVIGGIKIGGKSKIIGPDGNILAEASNNNEEIIYSEINTDEIINFRKNRPIYTSRRPEIY